MTAMIYVTAVPTALRGMLLDHSRLYAYPAEPELPPPDGGFVILDSGAFGLAKRGGRMTKRWMRGLAEHYRRYGGENIICIAPDVYLSPDATQRNWLWWQEEVGVPVAPVIQFRQERRLDLYGAVEQARFYGQWSPPFVAISNPALRAQECRDVMPALCRLVRSASGATWLHNLGAGWDVADVRAWRDMRSFDSIDSIAYYTAAQGGERWSGRGDGWQETAVANAYHATHVAAGRIT